MKKFTFTLIALLLSVASFATAPITGVTSVCAAGDTTRLADATPGGVWSSSNTSVATITSAGIALGIMAGTTTITYDVSGVYATTTLTVLPIPAPISGLPGTLCVGSPVTI